MTDDHVAPHIINMSYALAGYLWITCYNKDSGKNIITLNTALDEKINNRAHAGEKTTPTKITLNFTGGGVKMGLQ
ncbi:MAG: hypothetical protein WC364_12920 [Eubacteriales bacterium]